MKTKLELKELLPGWVFQGYGKSDNAVACFPPGGPSLQRYSELKAVAPVSAVCGPFYLVNLTIGEFLCLS